MERHLSRLAYVDAGDIEDDRVDFDGLDVLDTAGRKLGDVDGFVERDTKRPYWSKTRRNAPSLETCWASSTQGKRPSSATPGVTNANGSTTRRKTPGTGTGGRRAGRGIGPCCEGRQAPPLFAAGRGSYFAIGSNCAVK
jgi:hypothetical protein